jgi:tripartite-type tricarboxylate transporter receptor subunit TctC
MKSVRFAQSLAAAALIVAATVSLAQNWPKGPVKLIVPFAAGSTPDLVARIVADRLQTQIGKPVVVENKGSIAGPLAVNPLLFKKMPYDPVRDLALITIAATQPAVLVVSPKVPASDIKALVEYMQKNRGDLSFSSVGSGSITHLAMQSLSAANNAEMIHVPYPGSGAALTAVMTGDVSMALLPAATALPQIKAGKIKAIAVASKNRLASLPDVPTLNEAGFRDVQADAWIGFIAPAKTPAAILTRLHDDIVKILAEPAVREKLQVQSMEVVANSPAEFRAVLDADVARWKPVIQKYDIQLQQ